jgi:hypothetical protein
MIGENSGDPVLAWVGRPGEGEDEPPRAMRVPRQLLTDIEAEPAKWQAVRERVGEGDVIDFQRDLLAATT